MKGTLEKRILLETLAVLGSGKKTGVLYLTDPSQEIKIYIGQGACIYITGTHKEARLENLLIRKKLFPVDRINDLLLTAKKENQPLIQLLVNKKLVSLAAAEKLMAFHARHSVLKALSWPNGTYEFKPSRTGGNPAAKIQYDCRQLVRDITSAAEGPAAVQKKPPEESSPTTGTALKNAILKKMKDLPPTLQTVVKAKKMLASEDFDFEDLNRILEADQAIVANILKIANSSYYGMSGKIVSLKHAISMLGIKVISQILTMAGVGDFINQPLKAYGFSAQEVRSHSLAVGFGSRSLATMVAPAAEEDAFTAGLLHDVGKIMLNPYCGKNWIGPNKGNQDTVSDLEKRSLGWDHSEIAAEVFAQWRFPTSVIDAIRFHHTPDQSGDEVLPYILKAADTLAKVDPDDIPIYEISTVLNENVSNFLGLEQEDVAAVYNEMNELAKNMT